MKNHHKSQVQPQATTNTVKQKIDHDTGQRTISQQKIGKNP